MTIVAIIWLICTTILLIAPLIRVIRRFGLFIRDGFVFLREHRGTMKQIRFLQKEGFFSRLKVAQSSPTTGILDEDTIDQREEISDSTSSEDQENGAQQQKKITSKYQSDENSMSATNSIKKQKKDISSYSPGKSSSRIMTKRERHKYMMQKDELVRKAKQYKKRGQFDQYEKTLIEGMSIDRDSTFIILLADWYFHSKNFTKALSLLKKILTMNPKNHKALRQMSEIHLEKGAYDVAHVLAQKAITLSPQNPKYYVTMVEILYNTNQLDQAIALMYKVVKLRPTIVSYLLGLASLLEEAGEVEQAKAYYLRVVHIDQSNTLARRKLRRL